MLKQTVTTVAAATLLTVALVAQQKPAPSPARPATAPPQPTATERPPQPAPARAPEGQPVNIRLEITITDQAGPGEPAKKTITMVVADRSNGGIRSSGTQAVTSSGLAPVSINVDAYPTILKEGSIRLQLGLEYQPRPTQDPAQSCRSTVSNVDAQRTDLRDSCRMGSRWSSRRQPIRDPIEKSPSSSARRSRSSHFCPASLIAASASAAFAFDV